jgi:hypothetical protein
MAWQLLAPLLSSWRLMASDAASGRSIERGAV